MKNPRTMVALLAASALGLTTLTVAQAEEVTAGDASQGGAEITETDRQQRRAERSERREQRQRRAARDGDTDAAENSTTDRQQRRAERSERREQRQRREAPDGNDNRATNGRTERSRRYAERRDSDAGRTNHRRSERRQSEDRQARRDRRQNRADRSEAGRNARWRDQRDHREFNRRDFGQARGDRRRVAHAERRKGERFRKTHRDFDNRVDRRLDKLRARTRAGWKDGEITHREMKRVRKDRRKIARMDRRFGSDGRYTKRERRKLNNALDRASNRVYRAKHNDRTKRRSFDGRVDRRLDNLRKRTRAGLKDGEITRRELKRVRKDRRKIARMDRRFGSDGRYSKRERRKLNNAMDRASKRVYRVKHNDRVARNGQERRHRR